MSETSEMRNCPKCGKSINAAATRCEWCWEKVQPIQEMVNDAMVNRLPARRVCPHCGKEVSGKATRCKHCLEEIDAISPSPNASGATTSHSHGAAAESEMLPPVTPAITPVAVAYPRYRYQVVPFIGTIKTGFFSSDNAQTVSGQLQSLIEHYVQHGWEFYSLEKVNIKVEPGCLGQLLGQSASYISFDQVIFRQDI